MIGYKKVVVLRGARKEDIAVATLSVSGPVVSAFGHKLRCMKATVEKIEILRPASRFGLALSGQTAKKASPFMAKHRNGTVYIVGKTTVVENFSESIIVECAPGIHFYADKNSAINHLTKEQNESR